MPIENLMVISTNGAQGVRGVAERGTQTIGAAQDRAAAAADKTVKAFVPKPAAPGNSAVRLELSSESQDLAGAQVEMIQAKAAMKVGVALVRTFDELSEEALRLGARRTPG